MTLRYDALRHFDAVSDPLNPASIPKLREMLYEADARVEHYRSHPTTPGMDSNFATVVRAVLKSLSQLETSTGPSDRQILPTIATMLRDPRSSFNRYDLVQELVALVYTFVAVNGRELLSAPQYVGAQQKFTIELLNGSVYETETLAETLAVLEKACGPELYTDLRGINATQIANHVFDIRGHRMPLLEPVKELRTEGYMPRTFASMLNAALRHIEDDYIASVRKDNAQPPPTEQE